MRSGYEGVSVGILLQQVAAFLFYCFSNNDDDGEIPIFVAAIALSSSKSHIDFQFVAKHHLQFPIIRVNVVDAKPQWGWG